MNFKDTLRSMLLKYPAIFPNALAAYDHLFCVVGNGYSWENGQLVDSSDKMISQEEAILKSIDFHLVNPVFDPFSFLKDNDSLEIVKNSLQFKYKKVIEEVKMTFDIDNRMTDFTFEKLDKYFPGDKYCIQISDYTKIFKLPDNIQSDWLEAAEKMYLILVSNPDKVTDSQNTLDKIGKRIEELKCKNNEK